MQDITTRLLVLWLVAFSLSAATAPPHGNTDSARVQAQRPRGAVEELGQNGVTITVTTSLPPTTIYINPSTTVLTETRGTSTVWAGITILSKSWGCYIDSYINPPWLETRSVFDPRETTVTFEQRNTVFVTLTDSPPITRRKVTPIVVTESTQRTVVSYVCTNTRFVSYVTPFTAITTYTSLRGRTRVTSSSVCLTTLTPREPPRPTPVNPFLSTSVITVTRSVTETVWKVTSTDTVTDTSWLCDNPTVSCTSISYTWTVTPTALVTVLASNCADTAPAATPTATDASAPASAPGSISSGPSPAISSPSGASTPAARPRAGGPAMMVPREPEPQEVPTVTTQTTPTTPEVQTITFTRVSWIIATVTGTARTDTVSLCTLPTSAGGVAALS